MKLNPGQVREPCPDRFRQDEPISCDRATVRRPVNQSADATGREDDGPGLNVEACLTVETGRPAHTAIAFRQR
ncbi:hypothetical protein NL354_28370, partial [Klebsiella pneumoniae]|nr:hypothetical protein [Klebsiella pneumoniae]